MNLSFMENFTVKNAGKCWLDPTEIQPIHTNCLHKTPAQFYRCLIILLAIKIVQEDEKESGPKTSLISLFNFTSRKKLKIDNFYNNF